MNAPPAGMAPTAPCPLCQGVGEIFQDVGDTDEIRHTCPECRGSRTVAAEQLHTLRSYTTANRDPRSAMTLPPIGGRYCDICQDAASHSDTNRSLGKTIHQSKVCALWDPRAVAADVLPGDVVSSYRLLNYYAPMDVLAVEDSPLPGRLLLTMRACRWEPDFAGAYVLVCDGESISRDFDPTDPMPRAHPCIRQQRFIPDQIPPEWMRPRRTSVLA